MHYIGLRDDELCFYLHELGLSRSKNLQMAAFSLK